MKWSQKVIVILPFLLFFLLFLYVSDFFKDPNLKAAEKKFSEANGFYVVISEIDTFTNKRFANSIISDKGIYFVPDSVLENPNEIHHYSLKAKRPKGRIKNRKNPTNEYEFSMIDGGLVVDKNFKRIENPFQYRIDRALKNN